LLFLYQTLGSTTVHEEIEDLEKYMVNIFVEIQKDINAMAESLGDICLNLDDLIKKIEKNIDD
jgi:hypothetical protein